MRKFVFIFFVAIIAMTQSVCASKQLKPTAVSMVSYEQGWLDDRGTIALKNNTDEPVYNVTFVLEYMDMSGKPLDYETYSYSINIAPGKTKKLDIPAYEHRRDYYYYKSQGGYGHTAFKLKYELQNYNVPIDETGDSEGMPSALKANRDVFTPIVLIIIALLCFSVYVGMYVLVAVMAQRRNRNPVIWLLLSFVATPVLICIILFMIGANITNEY